MSIEQRGNSFRAQVMIDGKRHSESFATRLQAKNWIEDQKRRHNRGHAIEMPSKDSLASVIDRYIADEGDWSIDKTNHLLALKRDLGHLSLSKLTRVVLIDYGYGRKVSPGNNHARFSFLMSTLKHAQTVMHLNARMEEFSAAREALVYKGKIGRSEARTRRADGDEIELIAGQHNAEDYRSLDLPAILEILSILPIRVGELLKIRWSDINHEKRTVLLRERKHPDPKVKARNNEVIPLLKIKGKDTYDLLVTNRKRFNNQEGPFPYIVKAVSNSFAKARLAADVEDLRVHDLRAHAISGMLEAGIEPMMVMVISGHKDPAIFYKHYVRLDIEKVRTEMERKLAA